MASCDIGSDYKFMEELGRGFFGSVYRAERISDGMTVAIKVIDNFNRSSAETEVSVLKRTNHENIVKYIDSFHNVADQLCIVFEFADRGDLDSMIIEGKLRNLERDIWRIMSRLSGSLSYLHSLKPTHILHRDLKPANILGFSLWTDKENSEQYKIQCKVGDFGIAKLLTVDTQQRYYTDTCIGNVIYLAPEVLREFKSYSFPADIWSLGAVISFCCNKDHLFKTEQAVLDWTGGCPLPDHYSSDLRELVSSMLNPDPKKRPSAEQVYSECEINDRKQEGIY